MVAHGIYGRTWLVYERKLDDMVTEDNEESDCTLLMGFSPVVAETHLVQLLQCSSEKTAQNQPS